MAYKGNSYVGSPSKTSIGVPKPHAKPIRPDGMLTQDTWRYLQGLTSAPNAEGSVTVGVSPATFQATAKGALLVSGGTVSSITLTRNSTYNLGITSGYIPLSINDVLTVTYSVAPTMTWFPS